MPRSSLLALAVVALILSACGTAPKPRPPAPTEQLEFALASGPYNCDEGVHVQVEREFRERVNHRIHIDWNGTRYHLERDTSSSGLPRFEDVANGLVWIDLPWKGVLLDGKTNQPLINECHPALGERERRESVRGKRALG